MFPCLQLCVNFPQTFRDKSESSRSVEVWMASTMEQQTMVIIHNDVMMTSSEMYCPCFPQLSIVNLSERMATPKVQGNDVIGRHFPYIFAQFSG